MGRKASSAAVSAAEKSRGLRRELAAARRENRRLRRELEFRNSNISLLNQINSNMRATLRAEETYYVTLTGVTAQPGLGFNRAMLFIREPDSDRLRGVLAISPDNRREMKRFYEEVEEKKFDFFFYVEQFYRQDLKVTNRLNTLVNGLACDITEDNLLAGAFREKNVVLREKAAAKEFRGIEPLRKVLTAPFVMAPIHTRDDALGVIVADNYYNGRPITDENVEALRSLCEFASTVILSARKYEEAELRAVVDELTGLYNFRHLERKMNEEIGRGIRYNRGFSVILIDIDNFKHFNDRNGHLTGNKALMDLADVIRRTVRAVDVPGRFGGEEFLVILPETNRTGAGCTAEKLLTRIREHSFIGAESQPNGRFSVSGGVATFPEDGKDYAALMQKADSLLYLAKANGKDQILY
jgi:diguanylate cyclase (GGDEF)-like protein